MLKTCETCGKEFKTSHARLKNCSIECRKRRVIHTCKHCGKQFERQAWNVHAKFCSRSCLASSKTGPRNGRFNPSLSLTPDGHRIYLVEGYRVLMINGKQIKEHRHVMEQVLGRPLTRNEHVHHKDGNRINNSPDNLELVTPKSHKTLHPTGTSRNDTHKECSKCHETKPRTDFHLAGRSARNRGEDANHSWCKICVGKYKATQWNLGIRNDQRFKAEHGVYPSTAKARAERLRSITERNSTT